MNKGFKLLIFMLILAEINTESVLLFEEHQHHNYQGHQLKRSKKTIDRNKIRKASVIGKYSADSSSPNRESYEYFRDHLKWLNERTFDELYFCSSIYHAKNKNDKAQLWILRNKKCLNLSDTRMDFYDAYSVCRNQPFSYSWLAGRQEISKLLQYKTNHKIGLDLFQVYYKLQLVEQKNRTKKRTKAQDTRISLWLDDHYEKSQVCENSQLAPVVHIDEKNCKNGCFECQPRNTTNVYYSICVKACDWKVPYGSYCNTLKINEFQINKNLYHQRDQLIYVCQGNLTCLDYDCQCPNGQNFYSKYYCR